MSFKEIEDRIKAKLHQIADNFKLADIESDEWNKPVDSEIVTKSCEQIDEVKAEIVKYIKVIKDYWENLTKFKMMDKLHEVQNFQVLYDNHGFHNGYIKVRYNKNMCDLLLKAADGKIHYRCMCLDKPEYTCDAERLTDVIQEYSKHSCIPWGG